MMNSETESLFATMPDRPASPVRAKGWPHLPAPHTERWQLLRAGLQNLWEYDDQRFVFHGGRLLLRGRNESGKSKALEVLLPFLLDADLSPQRLDPFGSTSRPMYWNLINEQNPEVTVNVGYVWLEFGRRNGEKTEFCTIGAGLRAKRGSAGVDPRYFITSKRVDLDWNPLGQDRVPVTPSRLAEVLGPTDRVFDRSTDYRRELNARLFGMAEDQYSALIDALLELRRPQLSKRLDLPELSRVLSVSLPPLDSEVVGRLAEGFERLDRLRDERSQLEQTRTSLDKFLGVYRKYLLAVAASRAQEVTRAESEYQKLRSQMRESEERYDVAKQQLESLEIRLRELEREELGLTQKIEALRASKEYQAIKQLWQLQTLATEARAEASRIQERHTKGQAKLEELRTGCAKIQNEVADQQKRLVSFQYSAAQAAQQADFEGVHQIIARQIEDSSLQSARTTGRSAIEERQKAMLEAEKQLVEVNKAAESVAKADDRHSTAEQTVRDRIERVQEAETAQADAEQAFLEQVGTWIESLLALQITKEETKSLLALSIDEMKVEVERTGANGRRQITDIINQLAIDEREASARCEAKQKELDELERASHREPPVPHWRSPRLSIEKAGAPLYLLCDFAPEVRDSKTRANIEAALEASGVLDAWIMPDGKLVDKDTFDVLLHARPLNSGHQTLASVLVPIAAHGVTAKTITSILSTITFSDTATVDLSEASSSCVIGANGSWTIGPLHGRWEKSEPAFIGATSREAARIRKIKELGREIAVLQEKRDALSGNIEERKAVLRAIDKELQRFPTTADVLQARAQVRAESKNLTEARTALVEAETNAKAARAAWNVQSSKLEQILIRTGLQRWISSLSDLREKTQAYERTFNDLLQHAQKLDSDNARLKDKEQTVAEAGERLADISDEFSSAEEKAFRLETQLETLRSNIGADPKSILTQLEALESREREAIEELKTARDQLGQTRETVGGARASHEAAQLSVQQQETLRQASAERFRNFAAAELLNDAGIPLSSLELESIELQTGAWTFTDTLLVARKVDAASSLASNTRDHRERLENRVNQQHQELLREFSGDIRLTPQRTDESLVYSATYNGQNLGLSRLIVVLDQDIEARNKLLNEDEHKVFESFLSGETHEHLRTRVREAQELINKMNAVLEKCPTASGALVKLKWEVTENAPGETEQVIKLLLRSGHLLSDADRQALRIFLSQRLQEARESDGAGNYHERMMKTLDYRSWFEFKIHYKDSGSEWKLLTRKRHGEGSGGKKAVMLHLPLFAAAAAFFQSAAPTSPRLIMLDEAFAGIDPTTRGQLMGILSEFDLDFVMTSYEEWGFYEELDGLSTYHLSREQGLRGVLAEWFLWDGGEFIEMGDTVAPHE